MRNAANAEISSARFDDIMVTGAANIARNLGRVAEWTGLPGEYSQARWYAVYMSANREKRVAEHLLAREIEHFLPLYASVRRWKDRKVALQLPLFPGYVFVRIPLRDRLRVQQVPGVARLVGFNGVPTALPEEEIEVLRRALVEGVHAEPHPYLRVGRRVRIKYGPFQGVEGILIRKRNALRVVLSVDLIARSASVEIDSSDLERI